MSFLDTIKDRLHVGGDYYEDDYYDQGYEDDGYDQDGAAHHDGASGGRLLGTTPRPEAESVSVYTRSGRPVAPARDQGAPARSYGDPTPVMPAVGYDSAAQPTTDLSARGAARVSSGQLPPYVLRPVAYEDVQSVVRRVRTNQPVVVVFRNTNIETAKRILDFCFGFSCGISGSVEELGDRVFAVLPSGVTLSSADIDKLVADGDLVR